MQIDQPNGVVACRCGAKDAVCVKGHGAVSGNLVAVRVHVKIYQPPDEPEDPLTPPSDTVKTVPNSTGQWCIGYVEGAICARSSSSSSSGLPENRVWAWAEFAPPGGTPFYESDQRSFQGICQTNLPECCGSSSSSAI